jgi:hypothetical protein
MFVIDCDSPLSKIILETKLAKFITEKNYKYIITDKKDVDDKKNIIRIGVDIFFPFSEHQIEKYLVEPNKTENPDKIIDSLPKVSQDKITEILEIYQAQILLEIKALFEKQ